MRTMKYKKKPDFGYYKIRLLYFESLVYICMVKRG